MLTEVRRVFNHEDYLLNRQSRSDRVFGQYPDAHALETRGLNVNMDTYPSAPYVITTSAPVPSGFPVMPLFIMKNYAGVAAGCRAYKNGPELTIW